MKKSIILMISLLLLTGFQLKVFAQGSENSNVNSIQGEGNQNQENNSNQIQTQNNGEEQNLIVKNQDQESEQNETSNSSSQNSSNNYGMYISDVNQKTKELKSMVDSSENKGFGDKLRIIAQDQDRIELKIQEQLSLVSERNVMTKFFLGPDYMVIGEIKNQMDQNRQQIQLLTEIKTQTMNEGEINSIQNMIATLIQQNTSLQEQIDTEEKSFSLFGWLAKWFYLTF